MRPNPFRGDQQPQLGDGAGRATEEMRDMQSETGRLVPGNTRDTGGQAGAFREDNGLTTPMGEHPDLPARSGVAAVIGAADKVAAAVQAVAEIRELHTRTDDGMCATCRDSADAHWEVPYPCDTARIIEKWGL